MTNNKRKLVCLKDIKANVKGIKENDILCCAHCKEPRIMSRAACEKLEADKKWQIGTAKRLLDARRAVQQLKGSLRSPVEELPVVFATVDETVRVQDHRRRLAWWLSTMVWELNLLKTFREAERAMGVGPSVHEYRMTKIKERTQNAEVAQLAMKDDDDDDDGMEHEEDNDNEWNAIGDEENEGEESEGEVVEEMAPKERLDVNAVPAKCFPKYRFLPNEIKHRIFSFLIEPPPCHHFFRSIVCHFGHLDIDMTNFQTRTLIFEHHPAAELMPDHALWTATSASRATIQRAYDKWACRMATNPYCEKDDRFRYPQPGDSTYDDVVGQWKDVFDQTEEARFDDRGAGIYSQYTTGKHWAHDSLLHRIFHHDNGQYGMDDTDEEGEEGDGWSESGESDATLQGDSAENSDEMQVDMMQVQSIDESNQDKNIEDHDSSHSSDTESEDDETVQDIMQTPYQTPNAILRPFSFDFMEKELLPMADESDESDNDASDEDEPNGDTPTVPEYTIPECEKQWREHNILNQSCSILPGDMHTDRLDKYNTTDEMDLGFDETKEDEIDGDQNVNFDPIVRETRHKKFRLSRQDVEDYDSDADADFEHVKTPKTATTPRITRNRARQLLRRRQRRGERDGQFFNTDEVYDSDADTDSNYDGNEEQYFSEERTAYNPVTHLGSEKYKYHYLEQFIQETRSTQDWMLGIDGMDRNAPMYFSINHTYLTERERRMLLRTQHLYKNI